MEPGQAGEALLCRPSRVSGEWRVPSLQRPPSQGSLNLVSAGGRGLVGGGGGTAVEDIGHPLRPPLKSQEQLSEVLVTKDSGAVT